MTGVELAELGFLGGTERLGKGTTGVEMAAGGEVKRFGKGDTGGVIGCGWVGDGGGGRSRG